MKKIMYLICLCILLTACGSSQDNSEELYSSVIEKYAKFTKDKDLRSNDETNSMAFLYWQDFYDGLFSTQYDINDDGTQELLISLRNIKGDYSLLDIHTNKDDSLIRLTNKENGLDMIGERMNIHILKDGSLFYIGSAGLSGTALSIYELDKEKNNYIKTKDLQQSDVNDLNEKTVDLSKLEWNNIGDVKEIPLINYIEIGDYSYLKGKWKNDMGKTIIINEDKITFSDGSIANLSYDSNEDNGLILFNVTSGDTGELMLYIPKEYNGDISIVDGETKANTERITISQAQVGPEDVFYRLE